MSSPPSQPTATFPYRVTARIGEGAMGVVYRAVEVGLERPVAIKILRAEAFAGERPDVVREYRLRFLQEARAAAALSHPGVTTIYRAGEEAGTPFIAMEWLEGDTLEQVVRRGGALAAAQAVRLGVEMLSALDAAHRAGVVHRDIKPANLVLLLDGRLKVTDFGIARLRGSDTVQTRAGVVLATPSYASPEQLRGEEVDGRSDLFSVGILLFHLLTGALPFAGEDFLQVATAILRDPPVPLAAVAPHVPPALAGVVDKALAKDRAYRFQSAAEMAAALAACLSPARAASAAPAGGPPAIGVPLPPALAAAAVARSWEPRELGEQDPRALLERLLDRPLHAEPFAGAVMLGGSCVLVAAGLALGAVDTATAETGDGVVEALAERCRATLHPVPPSLRAPAARVVAVLASLLHPPRPRLAGLDPAFVSLAGLGDKLAADRFDGLLRFQLGDARGGVLFCDGREEVAFYGGDWPRAALSRPWREWVAALPALRASVDDVRQEPCFVSYRRELRDAEVVVDPGSDGAGAQPVPVTPPGRPAGGPSSAGRGGVAPAVDLGHDPIYRFLRFALRDVPAFLRERERGARWKYVVDWLADVRCARLHHDLPRPGSVETDFFDLATFAAGEEGRVLHVAHRVTRAGAAAVEEFRDRVVRAKTARAKTGDIGGAFLVARSFDDGALAAYRAAVATGATGRFTFGFEEALTGYEGFVRVGPRRGFHLLLVEESEHGFRPVLA